jgi:hypothetical protein
LSKNATIEKTYLCIFASFGFARADYTALANGALVYDIAQYLQQVFANIVQYLTSTFSNIAQYMQWLVSSRRWLHKYMVYKHYFHVL